MLPGYSPAQPPEAMTGAETVEMVMDRCRVSIRNEVEACGWLTEQVREGKLKLSWVETSPEYQHRLHLRGEGFIYIPCFPAAPRPEAARYLGISTRALEGWAVRGGGPRMLKLGSRVVYRRRDLDAWLATRERASTSDRGQAA